MPIDKEIDLDDPDGITEEDITRMNEEADKLKDIAVQSEANVEIIKKNMKIFEGQNFKTIDALTGKAGEGVGIPNESDVYEIVIKILAEQEKAKAERRKNAEDIEEIKTASEQFQQGASGFKGALGEINSFKGNPFGAGKHKMLGLLGKAGLAGLVAQFTIQMGEQLYGQILSEVKSQFGAGGAWDRRKLVEDELNEYNSIAYLTKIRSGQVFFSADAGQELRQGAVKGANTTRELRDGHLRYIQFHGGI